MKAGEYYGGWMIVSGRDDLVVIPGRRFVDVDCGGGEIPLVLPDPQDLAPGLEHWRIFVRNGSLSFGNVVFEPPALPVDFGGGVVVLLQPINAAGDFELRDNVTGFDTVLQSQTRGTVSPFVVRDGAEQLMLFQEGELVEEGTASAGQWLSVSFAGYQGGAPRWVYQVGDYTDAKALDSTPGLVFSHGIDGAAAPNNQAFRFDAGLASWRNLPAAPTNRAEAHAFALPASGQDWHFVCGGDGPLSSAERYLLDTWGTMTALPAAITGGASWDANALGYVHGGVGQSGKLREFLATAGFGAWTERSTSLQARVSHTGGRLGGAPLPFGYLSGGAMGQDASLVQRYQSGLDAWGLAPHRPSGTAIGVSSAAYVSDQGVGCRVFLGGRHQWQGTDLADGSRQAWELSASPVEGWRSLPSAPAVVARAAGAGPGVGGRVYFAAGGLSNPISAAWSYGPLETWRAEPSAPAPRTGISQHGTSGRSQA
jgi:hypothetical protein